MGIQAVIFDLDDTLYPQTEYVNQCLVSTVPFLSRALKIKDKKLIRDSLINKFKKKGIDYPRLFDSVLENNFGVNDLRIVKMAVEIYRNCRPKKVKIFSGVKYILKRLSKDYKLALITDGRPIIQCHKTKVLGIKNFFKVIVYSDSYGIKNRKPSPLPYLKALGALGVNPVNCVYVGNDPRKDFITAKRLGMKTIRVLSGEFKDLRLGRDFEADKKARTISEIEPLILKFQNGG